MQIKIIACFSLMLFSCKLIAGELAMNEEQARAMLNRFGYGATSASLEATIGLSQQQYLQHAIQKTPDYPPEIKQLAEQNPAVEVLWSEYGLGGNASKPQPTANREDLNAARQARKREERRILNDAIALRLLQSANSNNQGHEVLLNFWLNHFSVHGLKSFNKIIMADYAEQLRNAMYEDSFLALLRASFFHPAMQTYLDNQRSIAANSKTAQRAKQFGKERGLNENLARELLELHTLGVNSGYQQADVQALARIITGAGIWNNRLPERLRHATGVVVDGAFLFTPDNHDKGEKTLLGQHYPANQGITEIDQALQQLAQHPATAKHISYKLAQRFLSDQPPTPLVEQMAKTFLQTQGRISSTLQVLINSPEFATSLKQSSKFKEPIDFVLSAARAACDDKTIANPTLMWKTLQNFGQAPYLRSTPDGYGATKADWLSPPEMIRRIQFAQSLAIGKAALTAPPELGKSASVCIPDLAKIRRAIGPLSPNSQAALKDLSPQQQTAALLASPEFMHR